MENQIFQSRSLNAHAAIGKVETTTYFSTTNRGWCSYIKAGQECVTKVETEDGVTLAPEPGTHPKLPEMLTGVSAPLGTVIMFQVLHKIPAWAMRTCREIFEQGYALTRTEWMASIYWDLIENKFSVDIPAQKISYAHCVPVDEAQLLLPGRQLVALFHSHPYMGSSGFLSGTDTEHHDFMDGVVTGSFTFKHAAAFGEVQPMFPGLGKIPIASISEFIDPEDITARPQLSKELLDKMQAVVRFNSVQQIGVHRWGAAHDPVFVTEIDKYLGKPVKKSARPNKPAPSNFWDNDTPGYDSWEGRGSKLKGHELLIGSGIPDDNDTEEENEEEQQGVPDACILTRDMFPEQLLEDLPLGALLSHCTLTECGECDNTCNTCVYLGLADGISEWCIYDDIGVCVKEKCYHYGDSCEGHEPRPLALSLNLAKQLYDRITNRECIAGIFGKECMRGRPECGVQCPYLSCVATKMRRLQCPSK